MTKFFLAAVPLFCMGVLTIAAQEVGAVSPAPKATSAPAEVWSFLQKGKLSASTRYRLEFFDRDELAYPHTAIASTLRLAVGYETPTVLGFSAFAEYEGVFGLGPTDYNIPNDPQQHHPGYPNILDPIGNQLNQGWGRWKWGDTNFQAAFTVGRQEIVLNDGRFVSISPWRQNHQSFDAARMDLALPYNFGLSYAYLDRVHRVVGDDATDGEPRMKSHMFDLRGKLQDRLNVSAYGLLLDYDMPSLYNLSTETFGIRCTGPWKINPDWGVHYAAEFANQQDYAQNPNSVNANYWLGELGAVYKAHTVKAGVAWLGGSSVTDKLSTPLAHPFNGWTELFSSNPSVGNSHGLRATYISATGPASFLKGLTYAGTLYDYYAANDGVHYGSELDFALAWKVTPVWDKWEIGTRFAYYWADNLYGNAVRASVYTTVSF